MAGNPQQQPTPRGFSLGALAPLLPVFLLLPFVFFLVWVIVPGLGITGFTAVLVILLCLVFAALIYAGYKIDWFKPTVGVAERPAPSAGNRRAKTIWDWLVAVLIPALIPIVLLFATVRFNDIQTQTSLQASQRQHDTDIQVATDQQREATLQTYLDRMSDLLFTNKLRESQPGDEVRNVARARTLTALHALDARRNNLLIKFLREAQLLQKGHAIVDLSNADLSGDKLRGIDLSGIDLSRVKLREADLQGTNLSGALLWRADLEKADLKGTNLEGAFLWGADLRETDLKETDLKGADLSKANLHNALLEKSSLNEARLSQTTMPDGSQHGLFPSPSLAPGSSDLADNVKQWRPYYDKGNGTVTADMSTTTDPSIDGTALQISLRSGTPLADVQAYQILQSNQNVKAFELSLSFYLTDVTPIPAFDFTMSQWVNNQRWEWALQWKPVSDNTSQQDNWSLWTGSQWQEIPDSKQDFTAGKWYKFDLQGDIDDNNNVHYIKFTCGDFFGTIDKAFAPVPNPGDQLAIGVQLDGNDHEEAYDMYVDEIALH